MTDEAEDWGPWVEHDGTGCPVPKGTLGQADVVGEGIVAFRALCGSVQSGPYVQGYTIDGRSAWDWERKTPSFGEVLRYRIRKPRALCQLRELVENIPAPEKERQDA